MNSWPLAFAIAALILTGLLVGYQTVTGSDLADSALLVCPVVLLIAIPLLWLRTR